MQGIIQSDAVIARKIKSLITNGNKNLNNIARIGNKIIATFLSICLVLSNSNILLKSIQASIAVEETNSQEITINQEITKYIPFSYSAEDQGIILQQKIKTIEPEIQDIEKKEFSIEIPTYSEIQPEKIVVRTENNILSQDENANVFYKISDDKIILTQKSSNQEEYYITYYYSSEAYDKYLDTTHVKEYPEGKIVDIQKNEETGETWVYIDFEWDEEENEGEMPDNRHLLDKTSINLQAELKITTSEGIQSATNKEEKQLDIQIGKMLDNNSVANIAGITKNRLYMQKEINYEIETTLNIVKSDIISSIQIENIGEYFVSKNDTINIANVKYNTISITKNNLEEIVGETGNIRLVSQSGEEIAIIDATMETNEQGEYVFTYLENNAKLNIEINGIKNDGFLKFKQNSTILQSQDYTKEQKQQFKSFRTATNTETIYVNGNSQGIEQVVEILLEETITTADFSMNNNNISTEEINTGIEFKIELQNNNEKSDLWENPLVILELPSEIENVRINSSNLLYGSGITLHSTNIIEINGNKAIKIQAIGKQTDIISNTIVGGTTIIVNVDLELKELTPTSENNEIKMYYSNINKTNYENSIEIQLEENFEMGYGVKGINYIAPVEFKTIQQMSGFDEEKSIISSNNSSKEMGKLKILEPEKEVAQKIILMNNTGNIATQIKVIGKLPYKDNKDIITGENLGTTVSAKLANEINYSGEIEKEIQIYYSTNEEVDTDLQKIENGWTTTPESLENIKAYMITINEVKQGEKIFFEYQIKVPGMLEHGESLYSSVTTYYTNNTEVGEVEEISKANVIGLTTGIGARAKIELSAGLDTGAILTEGKKIKYKITVSNTGELPAENVVIKNQIPEGTTYVEETVVDNDIGTFNKYTYYSSSNELKWEIGSIEGKQSAQLEYTVVVDNIPTILEYYGEEEGFTEENGTYYIISKNEETGEQIKTEIADLPDIVITNKAILECSNIEKELYSNELQNRVEKSYFNIIEETSVPKSIYIEENQEYTYTVIVENKTDLQMKNLEIKKVIPEGTTYKNTELMQGSGQINYDESTRTLTIASEKFEKYEAMEIAIKVSANKLPEGVYKKEIITNTEIKAEGINANTSNSVSNTVGKPKITASIECDVKQRYIYEKDILNYLITITNDNDMTVSNLKITNIIPEGTKFISGSYIKQGNEYTILSDGSRDVIVDTNLKQETITVKIRVQVEKVYSDSEELEIINKAIMKANNVEEYTIGQIKHTIITAGKGENNGGSEGSNGGNEGETGDNGSNGGTNPNEPIGGEKGEDGITRYKIKGSVWNDKNKDGERQDDEDVINGVKVYLINENGHVIKDYKTGEEKIAITDLDGEYQFTNIEPGKYIVIFMYDSNNYTITEYQKAGIVNDRNSDAILKTINFEGTNKEAGVTDIIDVKNRSLYSIDLGLVLNAKFNMKLEAGINQITIKTSQETKQINYNMAELAKVEIKASQLKGATVVIEYNIKIINNGELPGSVTQIITNKANGITFSSSANDEWYVGNDQNLYLSSLANHILQPGESTDVKLVLVKQMTSSNTGTIENKFAITKTYNEKGQEEITQEDNTKSVVCIIATSTGQRIAYTGTVIIAFGILSAGIYIIRKKLTREKRWI